MGTPAGVAFHNPLNMRPIQPPFEGTVGSGTVGAAGEFTKFQSNVFGFRAAARNLIAYFDRLGVKTIRGIITRWAPPSDNNNTEAYITTVCNKTGYRDTEELALKSYEVAYNILHAMTEVEQGAPFATYFKQWELDDGLRRAGVADVPATPLRKRVTAIGGAVATVSTAAPQIQAAVAQYAPDFAQSPSMTMRTLWHVAAFVGGALAVYGSIQLARKQGV